MANHLSPEDLLAGAAIDFEVPVPASILSPGGNASSAGTDMTVRLRPLTIGVFQLVVKAGRQDAGLIPVLMIKESLVKPVLTLDQVRNLHLGLVNFLIENIREISGLGEKKTAKN